MSSAVSAAKGRDATTNAEKAGMWPCPGCGGFGGHRHYCPVEKDQRSAAKVSDRG